MQSLDLNSEKGKALTWSNAFARGQIATWILPLTDPKIERSPKFYIPTQTRI